jgi:outer membrane protein
MKNLPAFAPFTLFLISFILGMPSSVSGQEDDSFKVATVDVQRVFQEFHKTLQTEQDINEERIRIQKADRQMREQLKLMDRKLVTLNEEGLEKALTDEDKEAHAEKMKRLVEERNKLNGERQGRYDASNNQLNRDMMQTMLGILGEIHRFVESHAEKAGYDVVFDLSGTSTNQTPSILGGKGMVAITATVIAELNKGATE